MSMEDKRRCHRLNIELPASFKATTASSSLSIGTTFDISAMGICISSKEKLTVGQELPINIKLPSDEMITVQTRVVWVKELQAYDTIEYKIGVQIIDGRSPGGSKFVKFFAQRFLNFFKNRED